MVVIMLENKVMLNKVSLQYTILATEESLDLNWLSPDEKQCWKSEKQFRRHGNDWLAGRIAGKRSIVRCMKREYDLKIPGNDISIVNHAKGYPFIVWPILLSSELQASISIAHKDGIGFAVVTAGHEYIGCDVERNISRPTSLICYFSTSYEYAKWESWRVDSCNKVSLIWSCKEAAIKCLRPIVDEMISLDEVLITPINKNSYQVHYRSLYGLGVWWTNHDHIFTICCMGKQVDTEFPKKVEEE